MSPGWSFFPKPARDTGSLELVTLLHPLSLAKKKKKKKRPPQRLREGELSPEKHPNVGTWSDRRLGGRMRIEGKN